MRDGAARHSIDGRDRPRGYVMPQSVSERVIYTCSYISVSAQFERELHSVMARVQNPTLFSAYFGVPSQALASAGLIDPFLDVDVPLS
jgi:hypothetical protein